MKLYADQAGRSARQFLTDVLVLAWVAAWIFIANRVYALVQKLAVPGQKLEDAGTNMAGGLTDAGNKVDNVPGVGNALASPLKDAAGGARSLASAGHEQQQSVHQLAIVIVVLLLVVPLGVVIFGWLPWRIRWVRRASAGAKLRRVEAGRDLLALRALARQPLRRLVAIHPEPATAWRANDASTVDALAALELRTLGLRA